MSSVVQPQITIGLPVYNGDPYLAAAIESILGQTYEDFIFVISDNGSTDGTSEVIRSFAKADRRIRHLHSSENRGAIWNFNRVFAECESPYFKWAASDDLLAPTCVERCYETLREAAPGTAVLAAPETRWIDADGEFLPDQDDPMNVIDATTRGRLRHVVRNVLWGNTVFGLMVSDALRRARPIGAYRSSDWVLLAELSLLGKLVVVPEPLFFRRDHEGRSLRANDTKLSYGQWMDPTIKKPQEELPRVFVELVKGIEWSPLSRTEKLSCQAAMTMEFVKRHARPRARLAFRTRLRGARERMRSRPSHAE